MARAAAMVLFLAVVALVASAWMRDRPLPEGAPPAALLERFREEHPPSRVLELAQQYDGRTELLDPKLALPAWHRYPRLEAASVANATKSCPPSAIEVHDVALRKAYDFARARCAGTSLDAFVTSPLMHPSGKSYALLAGGHADALHVLERTDLGLAPHDWVAIARGDRVVLADHALVVVETGEHEKRLSLYDREAWERDALRGSVGLISRAPSAFCSAPASPSLCWTRLDPRRRWLDAVTTASASVAAVAGVLLALAFVQERRRASADRLHVFRTLTHELRTPAQSLGLDIELLQSNYDALPADAQESVLRVSEGIARLNRVIHRSARYLQLFDGTGTIVKLERVDDARELMAEMAAEWPEGVELRAVGDSAKSGGPKPLSTDREWLSVALRNLVENACRHGKPPVVVTWEVRDGHFTVSVCDAGESSRKAVRAYHRGARSQGLGLGLALVERIATLLNGKLGHSPSPTTWTLRFPA